MGKRNRKTFNPVNVTAVLKRKHPSMPRFVVIPDEDVVQWRPKGTITVEGTVNGVDLGRRSLKRLDNTRWFIDLPADVCRKASIAVGSKTHLTLQVASEELPRELSELIANDGAANRCWKRMTSSRRRMIREYVLGAKRSNTRRERAVRALLGSK